MARGRLRMRWLGPPGVYRGGLFRFHRVSAASSDALVFPPHNWRRGLAQRLAVPSSWGRASNPIRCSMTNTSTLEFPVAEQLVIKVRMPRAFGLRCWVASFVFWLGGAIVGFDCEVELAAKDQAA